MEGLTVSKADLTVYVHPSKANNVRQAILRQLSSLLFKYDEIFEGVILAYELHIKGKTARILPGLIPHFGVKVEANLLLFSPRPNMLLEGKVVKLSKESIHVIVLGFASAAIMFEDFRKEFKFLIEETVHKDGVGPPQDTEGFSKKKKNGVGVLASVYHKRHVIRVESMIRFSVKSLDEEVLHFSGSLSESNTGCIRWLSKHGVDDRPQTDRGLKRPREKDTKHEIHDQYADNNQSSNHHRRRKSKKATEE